ncbi:PREDICTED: centromere/kinetochore protein zw10 homolog isoform X2 [Nelumbo nucifera]|uniref:Centromere/kinetochore protein zw10 homolog isoform X2 n=1 Tax=Nelumbo nucifera TaxID=4432 RepID=A0A1U7ZHS6_NELNU|nr:PREDICTED: centromere/kinetochore protein zw10 homolog isoform X2 [Nelumbo nucifera]
MDVLFGSIDVRELLSVQEFDESSPLSAPDLRLLIDRLQVRSLQIKEKVRDYIISHHKDLSVIFTSCSEAVARTGDISEDVSNVIRLISDHPIDMEIRDIVDEINSKRKELKEKKEFLAIIQTVVNLVRRLTSVREDLKDGRLMDAAGAVRDLKKALPIHDEVVEKREPVVFGLLRKEWMDCFDEVREVLLGLLEDIISFEPESGIVRVKLQLTTVGTNAVDLRTVLTSMDVVDMLDYGFARVADLMVKYTIAPIVSNGCPAVSVEESDQDSGQMTEAILKLVPSSNSRVECMDGAAIYSEILQVIKFISKFICFENGQWMRCFGRLTWTRISELVISRFLSKAVPNDASKLAEFQRIIKLTSDFETGLKEMLFISASDSKDEKLSNFAQNVEVHFANRKKTEILAKARNLLLQCDFILAPEYTRKGPTLKDGGMDGNVAQHAVDLLFYPESCVVSKAASQLMELVHQTLKDVCLSSKRVAMEFYHAARDALLLYQAVIPVKLEKHLDSINQVAILVHNDCLYLSNEILGLAFEYRSDFPSSVKEHAVFVDMAPSFHQMAEDILQKQIQLVNSNLTQAIDGADGFQNTHQMQQYESAKFSIDQVVFILEKVHIIWEPLLLPSTYKKSMCIVLEYVFSRMIKDVLLLDDMAAEETLELQRLIHLTVESLSSLFESLIAINEKKKSQEGFTSVQLEELLPSLRKLRKLAGEPTSVNKCGSLVQCSRSIRHAFKIYNNSLGKWRTS